MTADHAPHADLAGDRLAAFVADTAAADVPARMLHEGKRALLNFIGCALGVPHDPAVVQAVAVLSGYSGPGRATLIGRVDRLDPMAAAFVNAVAGNLLDFDDTHLATVIHPTAPVAPPALSLAQTRGLAGPEVLAAFVLGAEVACRLGNAVSPGHYARGWHITATCGVFGAAAACARLLGLDRGRTGHALGIAASQSAGLVENLSTAAKNVGVGNAARNGLFAALLAERGYAAAPAAIEGPLGWARACGDVPRLEAVTGALGEDWEFARNTYKPYPCGIVMHAVVDACLELRQAHGIEPGQVRAVTVSGDALLLARGDRVVGNERDARVSIHHAAAVALTWGRAGVSEFSPACVTDPEVTDLRARVRAELDPSLSTGAARVRVETTGGVVHEATVLAARGSVEKPLADADIEAKVRELAREGGSGCDADEVIARAWDLDRAPDVRALMEAAEAPGG